VSKSTARHIVLASRPHGWPAEGNRPILNKSHMLAEFRRRAESTVTFQMCFDGLFENRKETAWIRLRMAMPS
jgi:hypothetical protein